MFSLTECWNALTSVQNSKSSGNDGFSKEVYVCIFDEVGPYLVNTLNFWESVYRVDRNISLWCK